MGGVAEGNRWGIQVDLNDPVSMEDDKVSVMMQQINGTDGGQQVWEEVQVMELRGRGSNRTKDSDPFVLSPIIEAINREIRRQKRRIEEMEDEVDRTNREVASKGNK